MRHPRQALKVFNLQRRPAQGALQMLEAKRQQPWRVFDSNLGGNEKENQGRIDESKMRSPAIRALKIYDWVLYFAIC